MNVVRNHPRFTVASILIGLLVIAYLVVPKYIIGSGSMQPTLPVGTVVIVGAADNLNPTDIITFQQEGEKQPTTHTFIGYAEDGSLMTKGDANPTPDVHTPPLTMEDVKGKVVFAIFIPRLIAFVLLVMLGIALIPGRRKTDEESDAKEDESQSSSDTSNRVTSPA
ncbi:MAG: signal peptidase I [Candidatus Microsaccharimonas sp.]